MCRSKMYEGQRARWCRAVSLRRGRCRRSRGEQARTESGYVRDPTARNEARVGTRPVVIGLWCGGATNKLLLHLAGPDNPGLGLIADREPKADCLAICAVWARTRRAMETGSGETGAKWMLVCFRRHLRCWCWVLMVRQGHEREPRRDDRAAVMQSMQCRLDKKNGTHTANDSGTLETSGTNLHK